MQLKLNAIIEEGENGWLVGQIEEMPAVISQGRTIEDLRANLLDALNLYLKVQRSETEKEYTGKKVIREELIAA